MEWLRNIATAWGRKPYQPFPAKESPQERRDRLRGEAEAARAVLESPAYTLAYHRLLSKYADAILDAAPEDGEGRELAYLKAHVLQDLVRELAGMVNAHAAEEARQKSSG